MCVLRHRVLDTERRRQSHSWVQKEKLICVCVCVQSRLTLCNPMDRSLPGSSSMYFSRQEYWNGLPFPTLGDLPDPGIKTAFLPHLLHWQANSLPLSHLGSPCLGTLHLYLGSLYIGYMDVVSECD